MKQLIVVLAVLFVVSCKAPEPPASIEAPAATPTPEASTGQLPKGIALTTPYQIVSDEWIEGGEERKRKTVIEFEQADIASVGEEVKRSMVGARYRFTGSSDARGGHRYNFRGDEGVRVGILVRPRGMVKLANSKATGNMEVGYSEPRATEAEPGVGD